MQMGKHTQQGASLVEVMVALFILAIGLLGVLAMQAKSMQYNQSAHTYSQAVYLANDIAERIRTAERIRVAAPNSPKVPPAGFYTAPITDPDSSCDASSCAAQDLIAWDKFEWKRNVEAYLPAGKAEIVEIDAQPAQLRVTVSFDDSRVDGGTSDAEMRQQYSLVVEI